MTTENEQLVKEYEVSQVEIDSAVRAIVRRKVYNARPEVVAARRKYMQKRAAEVKLALAAYRKAKLEGGVK